MDFVIYDKTSGNIRQTGHCPDVMIELQTPIDTSLAMLQGVVADPMTQKVDVATKTLIARPAPPPTSDDVNAERDRRLRDGLPITVSGTTIPVQADPLSMTLLTGLGSGATAQITAGNGSATTVFRDAANVDHTLSWNDVQTLALGALAAVSMIYSKSWALKAMSPIPSDYTADSYWT